MQVLCIETSKSRPETKDEPVIKGEIYNSIDCSPFANYSCRGVNMWHKLEERKTKGDLYHVCLFIELPKEESVVFSKKEELVEH